MMEAVWRAGERWNVFSVWHGSEKMFMCEIVPFEKDQLNIVISKEGFDITISCTGRPGFRDLMDMLSSWDQFNRFLSWFDLFFWSGNSNLHSNMQIFGASKHCSWCFWSSTLRWGVHFSWTATSMDTNWDFSLCVCVCVLDDPMVCWLWLRTGNRKVVGSIPVRKKSIVSLSKSSWRNVLESA